VPIPDGEHVDLISATLLAGLDGRLDRKRDVAGETIGMRFLEEQRALRAAPLRFDAEATTLATVTARSLVRYEGAVYSVPSAWAGLDVVVRVGPSTVTLVGRDGQSVVHARKRFGERAIDYRHYLQELARKPQALRQVLPDLLGDLGAPFPAVWAPLHDTHDEREAARRLAKILGELHTRGAEAVIPALEAVLASGAPLALATIISATPARLEMPALLRDVQVSSGRAADYDTWLRGVPA
jgi:hypothetical protein